MRKLIRFTVVSLAAIILAPVLAMAQDNAQDQDRAIRQKYRSGQEDGMSLVVYKVVGNEEVAINPANHSFKAGDEIRIKFQSNFDGYVYFINITPKGEKAVFYPDIEFKNNSNIIRSGREYLLPSSDVFEFDAEEKGIEVIQVVISRQPIAFLEEAIRNSKGALGTTASNAASELGSAASKQTGVVIDEATKVLPENGQSVLSRKIRLAPPKDKDKEGAVVTIPDKLKGSEIAVFEVRLRRI
jgi:hypothetical protein